MGNRAVITTTDKKIGVYLHWNGGRDSVSAFLKYCELRGFRSPSYDCYGWARLCEVIANFFGPDGLSVGIDEYSRLDTDNGDNGVFVIDGWKIVGRIHSHGEQMAYPLGEMLKAIDDAQPEGHRLGGFLEAIEIPVDELRIGDKVYLKRYGRMPEPCEVVGFGEHDAVNGRGFLGKPYAKLYGDEVKGYEMNPNNYPHVFGETCRIVPRES